MNVPPNIKGEHDICPLHTPVKHIQVVMRGDVLDPNLRIFLFYAHPNLVVDRADSQRHNAQNLTIQILQLQCLTLRQRMFLDIAAQKCAEETGRNEYASFTA